MEQLQDLFHMFWSMLLLVPFPWRLGLVLFIMIPIFLWFIRRILSWLLVKLLPGFRLVIELLLSVLTFPEYLITRLFRRRGVPVPRAAFVLTDIFESIAKAIIDGMTKFVGWVTAQHWKLSKRWIFLFAMLPVIVWYARPAFEGNSLAKPVQAGFVWWLSFEGWASNGKWASVEATDLSASTPSRATAEPTPSPTPTTAQVIRRARVVGAAPGRLRMRSQPDPNAPIKGYVSENTIVEIVEVDSSGKWFYIRVSNQEGWASTEFLQEIK